jgi:hypothetical protein
MTKLVCDVITFIVDVDCITCETTMKVYTWQMCQK